MLFLAHFLLASRLASKDVVKTVIKIHSDKPFAETHIPYHLIRGTPAIPVTWNGHKVDCLVDTGTSTLSAFAAMKLGGRYFEDDGTYTWAGNRVFKSKHVLSDLDIKDVSIKDAVVSSIGPTDLPQAEIPSIVPLIGDSLLSIFCVTIDPSKHELILRTADYKPDTKGATVLPLKFHNQVPYATGRLNGKPATFSIDTGWSDEFVVNADHGKKFLKHFKENKASQKGVANSHYIHEPCYVSFGSFKGARKTTPVCPMSGATDASIGWFLLDRYVTTIDYKRAVLIMKPIK